MIDSGRDRFPAGRLDAAYDLFRYRRRRNVDFADREAQQRVAHRAADDARFFAVATERGEKARDLAMTEPRRIAELRVVRHRVAPGTNLPFSICAGT